MEYIPMYPVPPYMLFNQSSHGGFYHLFRLASKEGKPFLVVHNKIQSNIQIDTKFGQLGNKGKQAGAELCQAHDKLD